MGAAFHDDVGIQSKDDQTDNKKVETPANQDLTPSQQSTAGQTDDIKDSAEQNTANDNVETAAAAEGAATVNNDYEARKNVVVEPSDEELALEQTLLHEERQIVGSKKKKVKGAADQDVLSTYMNSLSHIPLYTAEQELENARHLETLDIVTWRRVLSTAVGAETALQTLQDGEAELEADLKKLCASYERGGKTTKGRLKIVDRCASGLRAFDPDCASLDRTLEYLRRQYLRHKHEGGYLDLDTERYQDIQKARNMANRARNNFVRANLRLVISVARKFSHYRVPFIDLIQEGNVGLMKAVHRFDYRKGFRFSTYAHWWIRQSIERAIINKGSQIRVPVHIIDARRQLNRIKTRLTQELGREPSLEEIAGQSEESLERVMEIMQGVSQDAVSLDETINGDDPRRFVDMLKDDDQPLVDSTMIQKNTRVKLRELLKMLNPIEKDIIRRRFGLGNDDDQTLDEIGKLYNLSRERVRQIQAQGLLKMRRMCERRDISLG